MVMMITRRQLNSALISHKKWLAGKEDGIRLVMVGLDLHNADLRGADLRNAVLRGTDFRYANLNGARLRDADLRDSNFWGANLYGADLAMARLYDCVGDNKYIKTLSISNDFSVVYTRTQAQISHKVYGFITTGIVGNMTSHIFSIAAKDIAEIKEFWHDNGHLINSHISSDPAQPREM